MFGLLAAASLFITNPAPLEMPRAQAFFAHEGGRAWLEDRYNELDLWTSRTVDGRWIDDDGRVFILATLATRPPVIIDDAPPVTRVEHAERSIAIKRRDIDHVREAAAMIAPIELAEKGRPPEQMPRWYDDVDYWQGTNESAIVCAFRVKDSDVWRLATWSLVKGDDFDEAVKKFEDEFLTKEYLPFLKDFEKRNTAPSPCSLFPVPCPLNAERSSLRADARHSVAGYEDWHVTDAQTFVILDDLRGSRKFVTTLTNELAQLHVAATNALPTSLDTANTLCVARIYADRSEYLDSFTDEEKSNMVWSAAYWCPSRRELVAYLPFGGEEELVKTIRHEAFHQHLSYATAMYETSPWLNEGYAEYFENTNSLDWALGYTMMTPDMLKYLSTTIPALLTLGYKGFYSGTDVERRTKYRLAWSIAVFLEKGARDVRFDPFKNLKRDYVEALLKTHDAQQATDSAFVSEDKIRLFASEWLTWWRKHLDES